jgi:two-component system chemotaxis response regulator CheB
MAKIRVLLVDDAVVVRSRLGKVLANDPELEVVGAAATGSIALAKIPQVRPDVVILDVEMPEMDGLQTLAAIRQTYLHLPVIMFSSYTRRGATITLEALTLGASAYATKPSHLGNLDAISQYIEQELIPKIKQFGSETAALPASLPQPIATSAAALTSAVEVVAIGVSTGGPNALATTRPAFYPLRPDSDCAAHAAAAYQAPGRATCLKMSSTGQ